MVIPGPEKTAVTTVTEGSETQRALREAQKSAEDPKKEDTQAPVACITGVPRGPVSVGELARVTPSGNGGRTPPETLHEINQQYLRSRHKFKEGAPLKEYLRQRVPNLGETCTLLEVLTWLKEILFDESNPSMIVGDAPLEAALRKKRVHVNEIRGMVQQQLTMVEARQGPLSAGMLAGGMMYLGRAPGVPRPEARATTTPASTPNVRVVNLTEVAAGPVVLYSPAPGDSQVIGTVSYTPPPRPAAGQNAGGAPAAATSAGANFTGVRVRPLNRTPGAAGGPALSREAAASISQVIVTLTLLLANAESTTGFMAYSCEDLRSPVIGYELTPQAGCWMKQPTYATPIPRDGRIVWMRDGVRFLVVHCKMTETVMQADCDSRDRAGPWRMITMEKLVPVSPRGCMEISDSGRATLFYRVVALAENGAATETSEERVNCDSRGRSPGGKGLDVPGKAYVRLTMRKIAVWKRTATESITKKIIVKGSNDIIPNYVAGGMDATEGTYVWNYTLRNCPEEEWEELYKGKLGILEDGVVTLDKASTGQRARLRLEKGVTICGRRMRRTHLPHVYVEWSGHQRAQDMTKRYTAPLEERELESMRLEWSYLRGRDDYTLRRDIQDATAKGCWMKGTLMELRRSQAAGREGLGGMASYFGIGHLVVRNGGAAYVARCRMVVVELRNHTTCTQEIPVTYQGRTAYVEPLSLVVQSSATPVKCRKKTPPRWKIGKEWICGYPEIRPCNGPGPLPGHHRTNVLETRGAVGLDPGERADETRVEGSQGSDVAQETLEALAADISRHWLGGYAGLESLSGVIGTAVMGVSAVEMVASTGVRMSILYAWRGPGLWMMQRSGAQHSR